MKLPKRISSPSAPKAPKLLHDLYADLRDRRLLPLIALLVVAILATPILLESTSSSESAPVAPVVSGGPPAKAAAFTVVPAQPQLRAYRKRLGHRRAKNPFDPWAASGRKTPTKQDFEQAASEIESAQTPEEAPAAPAENGGAAAPAETAPQSTSPANVTVKASLGYTIDINAGYLGFSQRVDGVKPQTKLPKPESPAVVFTGLSQDKKGALFLMSNSVTAFYGEGKCVLGGNFCQVLELKPEEGASFAIGYGETRYHVHLLSINAVVEEATVSPKSGG